MEEKSRSLIRKVRGFGMTMMAWVLSKTQRSSHDPSTASRRRRGSPVGMTSWVERRAGLTCGALREGEATVSRRRWHR